MATEYRLSYTGSEVNERLRAVGEIQNSLGKNYNTSVEIDEKIASAVENVSNTLETAMGTLETNVDTAFETLETNINTTLETKADLVDGKVPLEQIPDDVGGVASWNDLEDKPFGESKAFEDIVWDGNTEGMVCSNTLSIGDEASYTFYKVSDSIITPNQLCGCEGVQTIKGLDEGGEPITEDMEFLFGESEDEYDGVVESLIMSDAGSWMEMYIGVTMAMCAEAGDGIYFEDVDFTFTFPETGLYFSLIQAKSEVGEDIICTSSLKSASQIKQIDPKFIPANLDFDLSDYYTKVEIDNAYCTKTELSNRLWYYYNKTDIDSIIGNCRAVLDEIDALIGE